MRLNWLSPLPPARSGIAEYAASVLPALAARATLTLWTDQAAWDPRLERYGAVRRYAADAVPWAELNRADLTVYHMGNHPDHHGALWSVLRRHPGLVVLHDLAFHHFFAERHHGDREGYVAMLERDNPATGRADAEAFWDGWLTHEFMADRYPLTALAAEGALAVVAHSEDVYRRLDPRHAARVAHLPLPYAAEPARASAGPRVRRPPHRVVVLGHLGRNRRLDAVVTALAGSPAREQFRLDVYGEIGEAEPLRAHVQALGVEHLVSLHGFVPDDRLDEALESAALAINVRFPSMGEASLSLLRMWDHALPVIVSRTGWYATLPPDTVAFVDPGRETAGIGQHLLAFLRDPARFAAMGRRGRRRLERVHAPADYAGRLLAVAERAARVRWLGAAERLRERLEELVGLSGAPEPRDPGEDGGVTRPPADASVSRMADDLVSAATRHVARMRAERAGLLQDLEQAWWPDTRPRR